MSITGECFCGKISYRIDGNLSDARSCHCSRCRKAFSAQASAYALVKAPEFSWTKGEQLLTTFVDENQCGYQFCSLCGSTLCGIVGGTIHGVTLGCVNGDPDIKLNRHIYVGSKAGWEIIPKGVPQYRQAAPDDS